MRDAYLNDIGDYLKYALLRELAGTGRRLGVLWYLTIHEETNNDGTHRGYLAIDDYGTLDPRLFAEMRHIERGIEEEALKRRVALLERGRPGQHYLPGSRLHAVPLQGIDRDAWWEAARRAVADCPIVFLDPDNGVRPRAVRDGSRNEPKYCRRAEVVALLGHHDIVVVYQHANRTPWSGLRSRIVAEVREDLAAEGRPDDAHATVHTLVASSFGRRGFICFARTPEIAYKVRTAIEALIARADDGRLKGKLALESD